MQSLANFSRAGYSQVVLGQLLTPYGFSIFFCLFAVISKVIMPVVAAVLCFLFSVFSFLLIVATGTVGRVIVSPPLASGS